MARVTRSRTVAAPVGEVWKLVSDPYNLPRWWPRVGRVENVDVKPGGRRSQWTKVLETAEGRGVRADYRCLSAAENERYVWEQQRRGLAVRQARAQLGGRDRAARRAGEGTEVSLTHDQAMRGLSRLGAPMMRRAQREILDEALDGIEEALG